MKKLLSKIFFLALFLLCINNYSQTYFGFKVGGNLSNINGDNPLKGIKPSMHVGVVAEIAISDSFSIQPELIYSMLGSQKKVNSSEYEFETEAPHNNEKILIKNNNHYITLPIMVKYFLLEIGSDIISIDAGPQVSYLLSSKISNGWEELSDNKDTLNAFDYGFNLGASYELDNGMNINIRYNYNFANIYKTNDLNLKANNTVIQISLGYKFY